MTLSLRLLDARARHAERAARRPGAPRRAGRARARAGVGRGARRAPAADGRPREALQPGGGRACRSRRCAPSAKAWPAATRRRAWPGARRALDAPPVATTRPRSRWRACSSTPGASTRPARSWPPACPAPPFARDARFLDGVALLGLGRSSRGGRALRRARRAASRPRRRSATAPWRGCAGPGAQGASTLLRQAVEAEPAASTCRSTSAGRCSSRATRRRRPSGSRARCGATRETRRAGCSCRGRSRRAAGPSEAEEQWRAAAALAPALEGMRSADVSRTLERICPSEQALVLDPAPRGRRRGGSRARRAAASRSSRPATWRRRRGAARAALLDPYAARPHRLLARAHRAQGDDEQAVDELRMALWCRDDPAAAARSSPSCCGRWARPRRPAASSEDARWSSDGRPRSPGVARVAHGSVQPSASRLAVPRADAVGSRAPARARRPPPRPRPPAPAGPELGGRRLGPADRDPDRAAAARGEAGVARDDRRHRAPAQLLREPVARLEIPPALTGLEVALPEGPARGAGLLDLDRVK